MKKKYYIISFLLSLIVNQCFSQKSLIKGNLYDKYTHKLITTDGVIIISKQNKTIKNIAVNNGTYSCSGLDTGNYKLLSYSINYLPSVAYIDISDSASIFSSNIYAQSILNKNLYNNVFHYSFVDHNSSLWEVEIINTNEIQNKNCRIKVNNVKFFTKNITWLGYFGKKEIEIIADVVDNEIFFESIFFCDVLFAENFTEIIEVLERKNVDFLLKDTVIKKILFKNNVKKNMFSFCELYYKKNTDFFNYRIKLKKLEECYFLYLEFVRFFYTNSNFIYNSTIINSIEKNGVTFVNSYGYNFFLKNSNNKDVYGELSVNYGIDNFPKIKSNKIDLNCDSDFFVEVQFAKQRN